MHKKTEVNHGGMWKGGMNPGKGRWFLESRCHGIFCRAEHSTENPCLQEDQAATALPFLVSLYPTHTFVNSSQNTWLSVPSVSCQDSH